MQRRSIRVGVIILTMAAGACKNGPGAPESNEMPDATMSSAGSGGEGTGSQVSSGKAGTAGLSGDTSAGGMNVGASGAGGAAGAAGEQSEGGAAGSGGAGASAGSGGGKAVAKCRRAPGFDPDCTAKYPDKPAAYACDTAEMASRLSDSYTPACSSIDLTLAGRFNECCPPHSP